MMTPTYSSSRPWHVWIHPTSFTDSGLSGPGRIRYGGVRDFILGITAVLGDGRVIRGGGKVVKLFGEKKDL